MPSSNHSGLEKFQLTLNSLGYSIPVWIPGKDRKEAQSRLQFALSDHPLDFLLYLKWKNPKLQARIRDMQILINMMRITNFTFGDRVDVSSDQNSKGKTKEFNFSQHYLAILG